MKNDLFAKIIIISGLIPIVLLTFTIIFYSENKLFENLLFFYSSLILCFIGAIYWGISFSRLGNSDYFLYIAGIIPFTISLIAFFAYSYKFLILAMGFLLHLILELFFFKNLLPSWMIKIRISVSPIISICLLFVFFL
tara:strand:- start:95 stop:508 length:414 start_codon:yes stop_codon:yes gene_type:complete